MSNTDGDDPELVAAMRWAQARGFRFWQPRAGAAWWGERESAQWNDIVFLDPTGLCNACRGRRQPGGALFAQRISGDALRVLRTVCDDWPV